MNKEVKNILYVKLLFLILVSASIFLIAMFYSQPENISITANTVSDFDNILVSYYPFNFSTLFNDAKGGNNLNCINPSCPILVNEGKFDKAVLFDGVQDELVLYSTAGGVNTDKFSFAAWVKVDTEKSDRRGAVAEFTKDGGKRRALAIAGNAQTGKPVLHYGNQIGRYANTADLRDGQWHHIVFTYDEITPNFYLDGVKQTLTPEESGAPLGTSASISIGRTLVLGQTYYFKGTIDEIRIYNQALTEQQVTELYNYNPSQVQNDLRCTDSDLGKNYTLKGTTIKTLNSIVQNTSIDFCYNNSNLHEFFCTSTNETLVENYSCPYGHSCSDGKCQINLACTSATVNEDCGAKNNSLVCYSGSIYNQTITPACVSGSCDSSNVTRTLNKTCSYGCDSSSVTCLTQTQSVSCIDSDSDTDGFGARAFGLYDKGNVSILSSSLGGVVYYQDSCANSTDVLEWFCDSSGDAYNATYSCPAGCSNEACTSNQDYPDEICDDSDNGKNYTHQGDVDYTLDNEELSFTDECERNYVVEYFCSSDDYPDFVKQSCGSSKICSDGECVPLSTNQSTGNINVSSECIDEESVCDGTYYNYCTNGRWLNAQQIPGQCGYQSITSRNNLARRLDSATDTSEQGSKGLFYLLLVLIVLIILGVIIVIYYLMKKRDKTHNQKFGSSQSPAPPKAPPFGPRHPPAAQPAQSNPPRFSYLKLPAHLQRPLGK